MKKVNCVLLIDDDGTTNFINSRIVRQLNLTEDIHQEFNGEKALNFVQYYAELHDNNAPELILLDLKMPVLDGIEFMEYLRFKKFKNKDHIKIIVLTNTSRQDDLDKLKKFDVKYLPKPLTQEGLAMVINMETVN
jgi:CheY-like chemotaxis protein